MRQRSTISIGLLELFEESANSGLLGPSQLREVLKRAGISVSNAEVSSMVGMADDDGDGALAMSEFRAAVESPPGGNELWARARPRLHRLAQEMQNEQLSPQGGRSGSSLVLEPEGEATWCYPCDATWCALALVGALLVVQCGLLDAAALDALAAPLPPLLGGGAGTVLLLLLLLLVCARVVLPAAVLLLPPTPVVDYDGGRRRG